MSKENETNQETDKPEKESCSHEYEYAGTCPDDFEKCYFRCTKCGHEYLGFK